MREWFYEDQTPSTRIAVEIRGIIHEEQSKYQNVKIIDTIQFGRMLALDDVIQVTELDEFAYHEMLAHVPLHAHPNPQSVLVVGGGDGGMVREASKHDTVNRVVLAEIDEAVINACINHVPSFSVALKNNPKLEIRVGCAVEYMKSLNEEFDVIIVDSSDPVGFAEGLFSREFYTNVSKALRPGGMVTIQGESPWYKYRPMIKRICKDFSEIFPIAKAYWANVPSYPSGVMLFPVGSKGND
ncbi:MAG: polyamine aminopropyltransferase, partial [Defluviitaleaceae bacterium]|nr:polyamine aminopropyltransferase [Defluviitaleaceae bacterium]